MSPQDENRSRWSQFWAEMRRRHVVRFAIGYLAAAFVALQLAEIVLPAFGLGDEWLRALVIGAAIGFPPALLAAWIFDVTPQGLRRTESAPVGSHVGTLLPRLGLMGVTLAVVGGLAFWMAGAVGGPGSTAAERADGGGPSGPAGPITRAQYDPSVPIRSIAVLPLENLSGDGSQDYFSAGMQEELILQLSQIAGLRVSSRTSVAQYGGAEVQIPLIGRDLGVDAIIEGTVQRSGDQVRITVILYHAASETQLLSRRFDRDLTDVFELQSEVAMEIAEAVQGEVAAEDASMMQRTASRDVDPQAADAYLKGRYEYDKGTQAGYEAAFEHFESAVRIDSSFAPAMAGLAGARFLKGIAAPDVPVAELEQALAEAEMAILIDSTSMEAREVHTFIERVLPRVALADADLRQRSIPRPPETPVRARVIHLPGTTDSIVIDVERGREQWVTAMTELGRRIEDQVRVKAWGVVGDQGELRLDGARQLMAYGRFDEAVEELEEIVGDDPSARVGWELLTRAEISSGDLDDVIVVVGEWAEAGGEGAPSTEEAAALKAEVEASGEEGYWRWALSRMDARSAGGDTASGVEYAAAYAALGDEDRAFAHLRRALEEGDPRIVSLQRDPVWDTLRDDPRFRGMLRVVRSLRMAPATHTR